MITQITNRFFDRPFSLAYMSRLSNGHPRETSIVIKAAFVKHHCCTNKDT